MDLSVFTHLVRSSVAFRLRLRLQPAAGPGTKVFPPTYSGPIYATESRYLPGVESPVVCVLLDSQASQANRMEQALLAAWRCGRIQLPVIYSDFPGPDPDDGSCPSDLQLPRSPGRLTSLEVPHRISDAILRDSVVPEEGRVFRSPRIEFESSWGQRLRRAHLRQARVLYEICPTALLFGMWDSTLGAGPLALRIERALTSEIVGVDVVFGTRTSSRIDPLSVERDATSVYRSRPSHPLAWTVSPELALQVDGEPVLYGQKGHPSEINHGNVVPTAARGSTTSGVGGVTMRFAELTTVISLAALRRFSFPAEGEETAPPEVDLAGQTVLAALGVMATYLMLESGLDLRSRCVLVPEEPPVWEALSPIGEVTRMMDLNLDNCIPLFQSAVAAAAAVGLVWRTEPLRLVPTEDLVRLVARSQQFGDSEREETVPDVPPAEAAPAEAARGRRRKGAQVVVRETPAGEGK
jgi:CRISPR-associated protein Csb1